ncbi:MAG: LysR family transcriptional regulator, partial [Aeromicrobium sp.]
MLNPTHLRTLREIIRLGSFTAAANRLGYTASAVSQQMSTLERETGTPLFERSPRSVRPTDAAMVMAWHAERVLASIDTLLSATRATRTAGAELRLGVFPSLAAPLLPRLLGADAWAGLGFDLKVWVSDPSLTVQRLRGGGELDVALVYQVGQTGLAWPSNARHHWLGDDEFRFLVPESWGLDASSPVSPTELVDRPWVFHHPGTSDAAVVERLFAACDLRPRTVAHSDDFPVTLDLVAAGFGGALVPQLALQHVPEGVMVIDVPDVRLARNIFALVVESSHGPSFDPFLTLV